MNELITLSSRQLALVRTTIAKDCNPEEFNLFCEVAKGKGLDPFLGQIIPMVFSKRDASKRKLTIIISRDGQRVIAQRCGDYRPAEEPPTYDLDASLISPTNPKGIVSATVYLRKQDQKSGDWYKVAGYVEWDEFAPLSYPADAWEWYETGETYEDSGRPKKAKRLKPGSVQTLDDSGNWAKSPKLMIAKCAEMQALRAGWPSQFSGLYDEAEMAKAQAADRDASEIVEAEYEEQRMARIGVSAGDIFVTWGDGWTTENVPVGKFFDRAAEFVKDSDAATVQRWNDANRIGLQQFWAKAPGDALELKKLIEAKTAKVAA